MRHDARGRPRPLPERAGPTSPSASWLQPLTLRLDRLGNGERERHARETAQQPGYGVLETRYGRIRYRMHGTGPALVFAADPPIVIEQYDELVAELAAEYRVIVFEPLGFGFSTLAPKLRAFSFDDAVESMRALLVQLGHGPYVLAFPCASSYSALVLAERAPELVSALVLAQAPSWREMLRWKAARDPQGVLSTPLLGQLALRALKRSRAQQWLALAAGSRERRRQFIAAVDASFERGAGFSLASAFQTFPDESFAPPAVTADTLFIWGLRDRSHSNTDRRSSLLQAPGASLLEAPQLGHFPELEDPLWFADAVRNFLRDRTQRPALPRAL